MFTSLNTQAIKSNYKPENTETAGSIASAAQQQGSIFQTETAGSIASAANSSGSQGGSVFCAVA